MMKPKSALVIGAHPDDCALGAGGFSVLLRMSGWRVTFLTMTDGELGGDPSLRLDEERNSAKILNVNVDFGHLPDGSLSGPRTVRVLEEKLDLHKPDLIMTHAPMDSHSDHRVLSESVVSAARRSPSILFYEGPSTSQFVGSLKVEIAVSWGLKVKSLAAHASQRERVRTIEWAETAGRQRAWPDYRSVCEAFTPVRLNLALMVSAALQTPMVLPNFEHAQPSPNDPPIARLV
ncbi:PIG-L deacetylase family protein [Acidipila sp. EB88]|uniref:PIG-L deacetylase family protein n=1 Tax=Acidipila sp. EB88 TaxID=2305226 RepID=UPI000F5F4EB7|nr:PIG-L deacetylase family protein [Acidipila sp. EB88]RRA48513.1 hypothetical protein D1Y84_09650 [Acidipila sp. EB88]